MDIEKRITEDMKQALREHDSVRLSVLRSIKSAITYAIVDHKAHGGSGVLTSDEFEDIIYRESKKRQDSVDIFSKVNENERADAELVEKRIIDSYLPEPISSEELTSLVDEAISKVDDKSIKSLGRIVGMVKASTKARVDGAKLVGIIRERLS